MIKFSTSDYSSFIALVTDSVKGSFESCWWALGVAKYLKEVEYGS